jgi:3-hydroxyisobutyrate dehydrogenase-like beta-hydroxyacid dehydrogenase
MKVAVLHPGSMGSAVGAAAIAGGHECWWASEGRSAATRSRAAADGLLDAVTLAALAARCETALSICPPEFALTTAAAFMRSGFRGLYVDANAVSPATARRIASLVEKGGGTFVDGGIVGGPPRGRDGGTRLYLSGERAPDLAVLFRDTVLEAVVIEGGPGAASALKLAYAAWTKGTTALILATRALARTEGVEAALLAEWARSQPDLAARSKRAARAAAPKAWRWVGEMEEIAATFAGAGLPDGFHRAAARLYERLADLKDEEDATLDEVLAALRAP